MRISNDTQILLAKQAFIDEGRLPSGMVSDLVLRSWKRCHDNGRLLTDRIEFNPVSQSHVRELLDQNAQLMAIAEPAMMQLAKAVGGSGYSVLLTDAQGTALAVRGAVDRLGYMMRKALRPGVDLSEQTVGTSAMAVALTEKRPVSILRNEHYLVQNHEFQCAAAPILDQFGHVIGSIDVSRDRQGPDCTTVSLVTGCAAAIETALFMGAPACAKVFLHWTPDRHFAGQPLALLAFDNNGRIVRINWVCRNLLGITNNNNVPDFQDVFHGRFGDFIDALRKSDSPVELHLANGLCFYASSLDTTYRENGRRWERNAANPNPVNGLRPAPEATIEDFGDTRIPTLLSKASRALLAGLPVLITGETGTGKEIAARALHTMGARSDGPFVAINCAAIPKELIEGELFGYSDGAFTGAKRGGSKGKIEQADGGTLFLDEVGDMPLELQTRLLRVLDRREVTRLGDGATQRVNLQLVCATHQHLDELIEGGRFREDLYFRISGFNLKLPPLRQRDQLSHLISRIWEAEDIAGRPLPETILKLMLSYGWPGNTRELLFAVRHIKAMTLDNEPVQIEHLPEKLQQHAGTVGDASGGSQEWLGDTNLKEVATKTAHDMISRCNGNITLAARELGISRSTLHRWLKKGP